MIFKHAQSDRNETVSLNLQEEFGKWVNKHLRLKDQLHEDFAVPGRSIERGMSVSEYRE